MIAWMGFPPEVHSTLLSSGPGPGPLLTSAAAWTSLSTQYAETAEELTALLAGVEGGMWEGSASESYVAAHMPYLAWLTQASADSAATAAQQEVTAAAYAAALVAMPTLVELAANHTTHAVLLATNFFGLNTIPIALNEADYARMWIQAATTMTTYDDVSTAALTASPHTTTAPEIVKAAPAATSSDPFSSITDFLAAVEKVFNTVGGEGGGDLISYIFSVPPGTDPLTWFVTKVGDLSSPVSGYPALMQGLLNAAGDNPLLILAAYAFGGVAIGYDLAIQSLQFLVTFPAVVAGLAPALAAPALGGFAVGGAVGVAEVALHVHSGLEPIPDAPLAPVGSAPAPGSVSTASAPASAPAASAPSVAPTTPSPAPTVAASATPGAPPPPGTTAGPFPYLVGSMGMESRRSAQVSIKGKVPRADSAAAPAGAGASAADKARERRKRRATVEERGRGYEYADMAGNDGPDSSIPTAASDRGAGPVGFTGTTRREAAVEAAGLATLTDDSFGGGPREPMMPSTWATDKSEIEGD